MEPITTPDETNTQTDAYVKVEASIMAKRVEHLLTECPEYLGKFKSMLAWINRREARAVRSAVCDLTYPPTEEREVVTTAPQTQLEKTLASVAQLRPTAG